MRPDATSTSDPPEEPRSRSWQWEPITRRLGLLVGAVVASLSLVLVYVALGGGGYEPSAVADPCASRGVPVAPGGDEQAAAVAQRIVLVALDRTACTLGTSRESLALALVDPDGVDELLATDGRSEEEVEEALQEGVRAAVAEAREAGVLDPSLGEFLEGAVDVMPVDQVVRWATSDEPPCDPVQWGDAEDDLSRITARIALDGVARAACTLEVPVADVVVAVSSTDTLATLAEAAGVSREQVEAAVRDGVLAAVDAADEADALDAATADVVRAVIGVVPVERVVATIRGDTSACVPLPWQAQTATTAVAAQIGVIAALRAACALDVPIQELLVDLADPDGVAALAESSGRPVEEVDPIVRQAVREAMDEAEANGAFTGTVVDALDAVVDVIPLDRLFATIRGEDISCLEPSWRPTDGTMQLAAQIALIGLADAACTLKQPIIDLAAALSSAKALDAFAAAEGLERDQIEEAVRNGLNKGLDVAEDNDAVGGVTGFLLEQLIDNAPVLDVLQLIEDQLA